MTMRYTEVSKHILIGVEVMRKPWSGMVLNIYSSDGGHHAAITLTNDELLNLQNNIKLELEEIKDD